MTIISKIGLSIQTPNNQTHTPNSVSSAENSHLSPKEKSKETASSRSTIKIARGIFAGFAATAVALTAGVVLSSLCCLILTPILVCQGARKRSCDFYNKMISKYVEPQKSMIFYQIRKKHLPQFREPTAEELSNASQIAQKTQSSEIKKFEKSESIKYTILSGAGYTTLALTVMPFSYLALVGINTYQVGIKVFKKIC